MIVGLLTCFMVRLFITLDASGPKRWILDGIVTRLAMLITAIWIVEHQVACSPRLETVLPSISRMPFAFWLLGPTGTPPSDTAANTGPIEPQLRTRSPRRIETVRRAAYTERQRGCSSCRSPHTAASSAAPSARQSAGCGWRPRCRTDSLPGVGLQLYTVTRSRSPVPEHRRFGP